MDSFAQVYLVGTLGQTSLHRPGKSLPMTSSNPPTTAAIDSVLAEFGRKQARPSRAKSPTRPRRQQIKKRTPKDATEHLSVLFSQLFPEDLHEQLQIITTGLAGRTFDSLEVNRMIVDKINRILRGSDLCLISEDGTPVRLRLLKPARSRYGYFQLRSADAYQHTVSSGSHFPNVRVAEKP